MSGVNLPSPELPLPPSSPEAVGDSLPAVETKELKVTSSDSAAQSMPATPLPMVDPSQFAVGSSQPATSTQSTQSGSQGDDAEDSDVIEKAWVVKAKAIVESTKGDPRKQSDELSNVKAEYIKKRFNKEVKTVKDSVKET